MTWKDELAAKTYAFRTKDWYPRLFVANPSHDLMFAPIDLVVPFDMNTVLPWINCVNAQAIGLAPRGHVLLMSATGVDDRITAHFAISQRIPWTHLPSPGTGELQELKGLDGSPLYRYSDFEPAYIPEDLNYLRARQATISILSKVFGIPEDVVAARVDEVCKKLKPESEPDPKPIKFREFL